MKKKKKTKAYIKYWACRDHEDETGYRHGQEIPKHNVYKVVRDLFEMGFDVMLHKEEGHWIDAVYIFVDTKRFKTR
jgi:hypothetical protein